MKGLEKESLENMCREREHALYDLTLDQLNTHEASVLLRA